MNNLVLSGGCNKGIGHIGCLKALEEFGLLNNINNFCGTSIGSIFSLLILVGYKYEELYKIILNFDILNSLNIDIFNFMENYSIYSNDKLRKILHIFVSKKIDDTELTFEKLFNLTKKNLFVIAINIEDNEESVFSAENTPNLLIYDAICASCAIPFILPPVKINNKLHIDGFLYNNFPCNVFNNDLDNTIGVEGQKIEPIKKIENIKDFIFNILINSMHKISNISYTMPKIYIYLDYSINAFDLLSIQEKKDYIEASYKIGKKTIENYLKTK